MPTTMTLKAEPRNLFTGSSKNRLRKENKVPGVVYGKHMEPLPIALSLKEIERALKHPNAVIDLEVPGSASCRVVLHDVQRDSIDHSIRSVDLHRVELNERIRANVRIAPLPDPEGKQILYQMFLHELHIECLPDQLPPAIELDLSPVKAGKSILVEDLPIPAGIHVLNRSDEVVVAPIHTRVEPDQEAAGA